jgi:hypothetical protein
MSDIHVQCSGPLVWYETTDAATELPVAGHPVPVGAILHCAGPGCGYMITTGNFHDDHHVGTPLLREGMMTP